MIKIENVTKTFEGYKALDNLTLNIPKGSIYGLMGLNGAGKTTIIKHLAGCILQDSGTITIDDEPVYDNVSLKQRVYVIPDELFFFSGYNIMHMAKYYSKIYKNWNQEILLNMLKDFGLDEKKNIKKFSKGMKKQAAFALAMATRPDYLILDEPVDGLDPVVRHKLWNYIISDVADRNMTVLIASHNSKELEDVCNYLGILSHGKLAYEGDLLSLADVSIENLFIEYVGGKQNEQEV